MTHKVGHLVTYTAFFTEVKTRDILTITGYIEKCENGVFTVRWFNHPAGTKKSKFAEWYMSSLKIVG